MIFSIIHSSWLDKLCLGIPKKNLKTLNHFLVHLGKQCSLAPILNSLLCQAQEIQ